MSTLPHSSGREVSRRSFLAKGAAVGVGLGLGTGLLIRSRKTGPAYWDPSVFEPPTRSAAAVVRASSYDNRLEETVRDGLDSIGADVSGRRVLIKPNLVEFDPASNINTDPRLIAATIEALRSLGASSVVVAEGPGHRRDTEYIVVESGLWDVLSDLDVPFVDLNLAPCRRKVLDTSYTGLGELMLPEVVLDSDVVLSMPKLKTHHWVGVTLSLKNLFGCVPGRIYGWPKNVLHWQGIPASILDVAGAVRPDLVIVDGVVGMQGDGPIMGDPVDSGHLVFSRDPVAADATSARLIGIDPERVEYLLEAGQFLGQVHLEEIEQRGEDPEADEIPFDLIDSFKGLRVGSTETVGERNARGG